MQGTLPRLDRLITELHMQAPHLAQACATEVKAVAPVGQSPQRHGGQLRDSITGRGEATSDGIMITIESDVPQAGFVIDGTAPHEIRAINAGTLRWWDAGGVIRFAKIVHHPGTSPNPFGDKAQPGIEALIDDAVQRAIVMLGGG